MQPMPLAYIHVDVGLYRESPALLDVMETDLALNTDYTSTVMVRAMCEIWRVVAFVLSGPRWMLNGGVMTPRQ
jgi:hypothetical protein